MNVPERPAWIADAACRGLPADIFFPERTARWLGEIRTLCRSCPTWDECVAYAMGPNWGLPMGWLAGMGPKERVALRRDGDLTTTTGDTIVWHDGDVLTIPGDEPIPVSVALRNLTDAYARTNELATSA